MLTPSTDHNAWDSAGVEQPNVIIGGKSVMMFYDGLSEISAGRIGLAFAQQGAQVFPVPEFPYIDLPFVISAFAVVAAVRSRKQPK